jgi:acetylornithine deacetylase/succinyl-diaminopimelate desuccinylase-like protein
MENSKLQSYIQKHQQRMLDELFDFLRIPSVGCKPEAAADTRRAADFVVAALKKAGADKAHLIELNDSMPLVYGERIVDPSLPTVLVYGHYDVQPAEPLELWDTPPFAPEIREGKIYARGACDDKGQVYAHVKALEVLESLGGAPCNIKYVIEGEEEVGSPGINRFLDDPKHLQLLKADAVLVSDTSIIGMNQPSMPVALRGIATLEVSVTGPERDLHSGVYGGAVANPIDALSKIIAQLKDAEGRITVPDFYDGIVEHDEASRRTINNHPFDEEAYKKDLGVAQLHGEAGYTTLERTGIRPTLELNGIWGGYTGEGFKTVLPAKAHAKISMRLVAGQDPKKIVPACKAHIEALAPVGVRVDCHIHDEGSPALLISTKAKAIAVASEALAEVWGKQPHLVYEGGSIPILSKMQEGLKVPIVLMGFGLDSDNIHSPNERFGVENYTKAIATITTFLQRFAIA